MKIADQIKSVEREIALRMSAYRKFVEKGTMKQETSDHELAAMRAVLATLKDSQYIETIPVGGVRVEIRGITATGKRHAVVKVVTACDNDTLLISSMRDAALEFWRFFSR